MAEALCGPSNPLQNIQKHTAVDRTLQQDRLATRQSPIQGFRPSSGPNAGILDAEFEAFQAGQLQPIIPLESHFYDAGGLSNLSGYDVPHQQMPAPGWAADFQRLNLGANPSSTIPSSQFRHEAPLQRGTSAGWHQDFMQRQNPQSLQQSPLENHWHGKARLGNMPGSSFDPFANGLQYQPRSVAQQKQPERQQEDVFDEEAFERAFDAAKLEAERSERVKSPAWLSANETEVMSKEASDHRDETDCGDVLDQFNFDSFLRDQPIDPDIGLPTGPETKMSLADYIHLQLLEQSEKKRLLAARTENAMLDMDRAWREKDVDIGYLRQNIKDNSAELLFGQENHETVQGSHAQEDYIRRMMLLEQQNKERLLMARQERDELQAEHKKSKEEQNQRHKEADELSRTAGQLLDNLSHEQSQKFKESSFMALMRQLRDKEVTVEGDHIVDSSQPLHPGGQFYPSGSDATMSGAINTEEHEAEQASGTA